MAPMVALNAPCCNLPLIVFCPFLCFGIVSRSEALSTCVLVFVSQSEPLR
jgi:hypothetical protein